MTLHGLATPPFGAFVIDDQTIASAAQFTFTVPQTFTNLMLVCSLRGAQAVTGSGFRLRFNGDSGTNYNHQVMDVANVTFAGVVGVAQTYIMCGRVPGASAPSNYFGSVDVVIPNYRGSVFKAVTARHACSFGTAAADLRYGSGGGTWLSTSAITSITVWHDSGAGTYDVGSRVTLYGMLP